MRRYDLKMPSRRSISPSGPRAARPINQWVRDALAFAKIGQAELARELARRRVIPDDRSIVNKMTISRDVSAEEVFAISEITGFSAPNAVADAVIEIPLVSWVSAGDLRNLAMDEALAVVKMAGLPPGDWIALKVQGDSMDRISPPESIILVNRADRRLVPNACYVIDDGDGNASYKRFRPNPVRFEPVSTNKDLPTFFPENDPTIVGRVRKTILDM